MSRRRNGVRLHVFAAQKRTPFLTDIVRRCNRRGSESGRLFDAGRRDYSAVDFAQRITPGETFTPLRLRDRQHTRKCLREYLCSYSSAMAGHRETAISSTLLRHYGTGMRWHFASSPARSRSPYGDMSSEFLRLRRRHAVLSARVQQRRRQHMHQRRFLSCCVSRIGLPSDCRFFSSLIVIMSKSIAMRALRRCRVLMLASTTSRGQQGSLFCRFNVYMRSGISRLLASFIGDIQQEMPNTLTIAFCAEKR